MHARVPGTVKWLQQVVRGYFQYHAISGNSARLRAFRSDVLWSWLQTLRRRGQQHRMNWERFIARLNPCCQQSRSCTLTLTRASPLNILTS